MTYTKIPYIISPLLTTRDIVFVPFLFISLISTDVEQLEGVMKR